MRPVEKIIEKHDYPKKVDGKVIETPAYDDDDLRREGRIYSEKLRIESLLEVRDEIEVVEGEMAGMFGRVINILPNNVLRLVVNSDMGEIEIDKDVHQIRQVFRVGDTVTIKIGALAGRTGLVEVTDNGNFEEVLENGKVVEVCGDRKLVIRELNTMGGG